MDQLIARMRVWNLNVENRGLPLDCKRSSDINVQNLPKESTTTESEGNGELLVQGSDSKMISSFDDLKDMEHNDSNEETGLSEKDLSSSMVSRNNQSGCQSSSKTTSPSDDSLFPHLTATSTRSSVISSTYCPDSPTLGPSHTCYSMASGPKLGNEDHLANTSPPKLDADALNNKSADIILTYPVSMFEADMCFSNPAMNYQPTSKIIEATWHVVPVFCCHRCSPVSSVVEASQMCRMAKLLAVLQCFADAFDLFYLYYRYWYAERRFQTSEKASRSLVTAVTNCARCCSTTTQIMETRRILEQVIEIFKSCGQDETLDCLLLQCYLIVLRNCKDISNRNHPLQEIFDEINRSDLSMLTALIKKSCNNNNNSRNPFIFYHAGTSHREYLFLMQCLQTIQLQFHFNYPSCALFLEPSRNISTHLYSCSQLSDMLYNLLEGLKVMTRQDMNTFETLLCIYDTNPNALIRGVAYRVMVCCFAGKILNRDGFVLHDYRRDAECDRWDCHEPVGHYYSLGGIMAMVGRNAIMHLPISIPNATGPEFTQRIAAIEANYDFFKAQLVDSYLASLSEPACIRQMEIGDLNYPNLQSCIQAALGSTSLLWEYFDGYKLDKRNFQTAQCRAKLWQSGMGKVSIDDYGQGNASSTSSIMSNRSSTSFGRFYRYAKKINGWSSSSKLSRRTSISDATVSVMSIDSSENGSITGVAWSVPKLGVSLKDLVEDVDIDDDELEEMLMEID